MKFLITCFVLRMNRTVSQRIRMYYIFPFKYKSIYDICKNIIVILKYFFG